MSESATESSTNDISAHDLATGAELRATAKWLCAGAGAIATAMVAGLQLTELGTLPRTQAVVAVAATVVVIGAAGVILWKAASVLAARSPSMQTLVKEDQADGGGYPDPRVDEPKTRLMRYLLIERRLELLGPVRDSFKALVVDQNAAYRGLWHGQVVEVDGRRFDPANPQDREALQSVGDALGGRFLAVLAAAQRWEVETRFRQLKLTLAVAGSIVVTGVLTYAWVLATAPPRVQVEAPVPASVKVPSEIDDAETAGFRAECAGETLQAVIVGGWLDDPLITTSATATCPSHSISPGRSVVVVPIVK